MPPPSADSDCDVFNGPAALVEGGCALSHHTTRYPPVGIVTLFGKLHCPGAISSALMLNPSRKIGSPALYSSTQSEAPPIGLITARIFRAITSLMKIGALASST